MKTRTKLWMVLLITLLLAVIFIPTACFAAEEIASGTCGAEGYDLTWILTDDGTLTISGEGEMEGSPWSEYKDQITSVVIEEGVTSISEQAFYDYDYLTSITIPKSVESICKNAFYLSSKLTDVFIEDIEQWMQIDLGNLPANPLLYADNLQLNGEILTELTVSGDIKTVNPGVFYNYDKLESVVFSEGVETIESSAFRDCDNLKSISFANSVKKIGSFTFGNCISLKNIELGDATETIGNNAFHECESLESITVNSKLKSIGIEAFKYCDKLTTVHINDLSAWMGIEFADEYATPLKYAKNLYLNGELLTELVIPDDFETIGQYAFCGNEKLTKVTVPATVKKIGKGAFENCVSLSEVVLAEGLQEIGACAFQSCRSITEVVLPKSTERIGNYAFSGCMALEEIVVPEKITALADSVFDQCIKLKAITLPSGLKSIGSHAFRLCKELDALTIPNSVETIGYGAFSECSSLKEIVIPEGVTTIETLLFEYCTSLERIYLPKSVTEFEMYPFQDCDSLKEVHITDLEKWCQIDFDNGYENPLCYAKSLYLNGEHLTDVVIPESITELKPHTFRASDITSLTMHDNITSMDDCINNCRSLEKIVFSKGLEKIPAVLSNLDSLEEVVFPEGVKELDRTFSGSTAVKKITFPSTLTKITNAFMNNNEYALEEVHITDLEAWLKIEFDDMNFWSYPMKYAESLYLNGELVTDLVIPETVTVVNDAFRFYKNLKSLTLHENVEKIMPHAFGDCTGLETVDFGGTQKLREIKYGTFSGCSALKELTFPEGLERIESNVINLERVTFPKSFKYYNAAFMNENFKEVHISDMSAWLSADIEPYLFDHTTSLYLNGELVTEVVTPKGVTRIGNGVFANYLKLKKITFSEDVEEIGENILLYCDLEEIRFLGDPPKTEYYTFWKEGDDTYYPCDNSLWTEDARNQIWCKLNWIPAHDFTQSEWYTETEPTCTEEGEDRRDCSICGRYESRVVPKLGHDYESSEWYTETEPTCTEEGEKRRDCARCDGYESEILQMIPHTIEGGTWQTVKEPTCSSHGVEQLLCGVCGNLTQILRQTPGIPHDFEVWVTETEPTCTTRGWAKSYCNNCSGLMTKPLPAKGHTIVFDEAVEPTYTSTGLTMGQHCSVCGEVLYPQEIVPMLKVSTPTNVKAESAGYNAVKLTWNEVANATGYVVHRYDAVTNTYKKVKATLDLTLTDTNLVTGTEYSYQVCAYRKVNGEYIYGDFTRPLEATPLPEVPTGLKAESAGYNSVKLSWNKVTGATGYVVYRYDAVTDTYKKVKATLELSFTDTGLTTGTNQYYRVRAYRKVNGVNIWGALSTSVVAKPIPATVTGVKAASAGYNAVKLTWNKVPGATGYGIYRYDAAKKTYVYYKPTLELSFTDTGLTTGTNQYYRVRAYRKVNGVNVWGALSTSVVAKPVPATPSITAKNAGSRKIKVGWNKVSGASGYEIYRSTSKSGTYSKIKTVTSGSTVSFTNSGLTKGKTYYYKVRAYRTVSGKKVYGSYSAVKYAKG